MKNLYNDVNELKENVFRHYRSNFASSSTSYFWLLGGVSSIRQRWIGHDNS